MGKNTLPLWKSVVALVRKEFTLELRQRYALGGILLYVVSTVFVTYLAFMKIRPDVWNVLFWIISLFASVNAVVKSFVQENNARQLYFYQIANPTAFILAKIIYNSTLLFVLNTLQFGALSLAVGNPVKDMGLFFQILLMASLSFGIALTFTSAIAAKSNNAATMTAILSFPIVIPILSTLIKLSATALRLLQDTAYQEDFVNLWAIDAILLGLCLVLFPYLWRD